jgi:hypothetical protein
MSILNNYRAEDYNAPQIEEGEHLLTIKKVVERVSNASGNNLLEIELNTKNGFRLFFHIVE